MVRSHKQLFLLYSFNQGLHWFAVGIVIPVMILALLDFGFDIGLIGIKMAVMGTTVLLLELPTGGLADTVGRKRIYLIAIAVYTAGFVIILFSRTFPQLLAAAVLTGAGRALSSGTMDAWFVDEHKRLGGNDILLQKDLAGTDVIITLALGAGTLLGGFIPDITGEFRTNILVLIFLYLLQMILTAVLIKEDRRSFSGSITDGFKRFPHVLATAVSYGLKKRNILILLIAAGALGIGVASMEQLWQPRVREISPDTGTWFLGVLSAGYFASAAAGSALSAAVMKISGRRYRLVLFVSRVLMAVLFIMLSSAAGLGAFTPLYLIILFTQGVSSPTEMTLFNRDIPSERRSSLLSLKSLFFQGGGAAGAAAAGQAALYAGIPAAWRIAGVLLAVSAFAYLFLKENVHANQV